MRLHDDAVLQSRLASSIRLRGRIDLAAAKKVVDRVSEIIAAGNGDPYAGMKTLHAILW